MLLQDNKPHTWVEFKEVFSESWLTTTFEVDVLTAWHSLTSASCRILKEYKEKFWCALVPVSSYRIVTLTEQVEKYCCGLPKEIRDYCTKSTVTNMSQLTENAATADALLHGKAGT